MYDFLYKPLSFGDKPNKNEKDIIANYYLMW